MSKNYYYLVASLPELALDDSKLNFTMEEFKSEIYPMLACKDKGLIDLLYLQFDNANILKLLDDKDATIDAQGVFSLDELIENINTIKDGGEVCPKLFPSYLSSFISDYFQGTLKEELLLQDQLTNRYYDYARKCKNQFISKWFDFNFNINNILTALISRKYKWDTSESIIGDSEISEALRTSGARDFGISNEVDFFDNLIKINELDDLIEREKKLDLLRWDWMEENSFFCYFSIERLFVFLIQIQMIARWVSLDREMGNTIFRNIIDSLKNDVQIPAEFR